MGKALINATKRIYYLHFFANSKQKIVKKDKVKRTWLHLEKQYAIKKFYKDS